MRNLNAKAFIWVLAVASALVWVSVRYATGGGFQVTWKSLQELPSVVSIDAALWVVFVKWGWRYRVFQGWLVPFPCLEGSWEGTVATTWSDSQTGETPMPIPVVLVIKQSFIYISCTMYSQEMTSRSYAGELLIDPETNSKRLTYTYTSAPRATVRHRSVVHDGTALLDIVSGPVRALRGEYWTNRGTTGEIALRFKSKEVLESLPQGADTHPNVSE